MNGTCECLMSIATDAICSVIALAIAAIAVARFTRGYNPNESGHHEAASGPQVLPKSAIVRRTKEVVEGILEWCPLKCRFRKYRWFAKPKGSSPTSDRGTEAWVLGNLLLAAMLALCPRRLRLLGLGWLLYGTLRILELVLTQVRIFVVQKDLEIESEQRSLILAIMNYVEVTLWFAVAYRTLACAFEPERWRLLGSRLGSLYFSFAQISLLGAGEIGATERLGQILVLVEGAIGLFLALVVLASLVGLSPRHGNTESTE